MTEFESEINISGSLEGLSCTEKDISELIKLLIKVEPKLEQKLISKSINLSFLSKSEIEKLNSKFLNKNKPTNVLSFPSSGFGFDDAFLGDIAICPEIIVNEAHEQGKDKQNHLSHIIMHSLLHLAGYDHQDRYSSELMESLEIIALKKLGIANPYWNTLRYVCVYEVRR